MQYYRNTEGQIVPFDPDPQPSEVIGILEDFHFQSLYHEIKPLALFLSDDNFSVISIKFRNENLSELLSELETSWNNHFPDIRFEVQFLESSIESQYRDEKYIANLISVFSILALFIGGLGIFGLVAFIIESRSKELSIRKVIGASAFGLILLLNRKLLKPVAAALIGAIPFSWYLMNLWLSNFAYKVKISWQVVLVTLITLLVVLIISVGVQTWRAAMVNPIESLRNE